MQDFMRELPVDDTNNPGRVITQGLDVLTHEDPGVHPSVAERLAHIGIPDARWVTLPARSAGGIVGAIGLTFHGNRAFTSQEIELFEGLAATLGSALGNARLHAELTETGARLGDILTSMTDGFVTVDRDWRYTWMNPMAERLIHRTADDLIGKSLIEEFPNIDGIARYRRVMEDRTTEVFETFSEPVGTWLEVRAYPSAGGMSVFFADITARKAAEAALAESRGRADLLASILENSAQPFGVGAPNGDLLLTNRAFERLTGYSVEELSQISWAEVLTPPEYAEFEAQQLAVLEETGAPVRYEKEYIRKDGTRVPIELLVHAAKDEMGRVSYYYSFVTDLTQRKAAEAAIEEERGRLREIIEEIPMGVALVDANGAVLELNEGHDAIWAGTLPRAESIEGFAVYRGYRLDNGEPMAAEDWPAPRVIATGEPVQEVVEIERFDGTRAPVRISANPILDKNGALSRVVVVTEDVSEEFQRQHLSQALIEIGAAITLTLDSGEVLHRVTKLAAQALGAETASLTVREGGEWVMRECVSPGRRKVSSAFSDPVFARAVTEAAEHVPVVIDDVENDSRVDPIAMRKLGIRSLMAVPIVAQQEAVGALVFHYRAEMASFSPEQVDFAARLMAVVALALENARLYQRELTIANTLQEAILTPPEVIEGFEIDYLYKAASETASVGGDFYDVFHIDSGQVAIVIGDVAGKGIEAARLTSLLRDGVRAYALEGASPTQLLGSLNALVHRTSPIEAYATMFFAVLDPLSGALRYCTAGHPAPAIVGSGTACFLESTRSPILGAFENVTFEIAETTIERGDTLVMFTDGVTEARTNGEQFGEARLLPALAKLSGVRTGRMSQTLLDRVLKFTGGVLYDDTVILCLRRLKAAAD
jgi:PAS domain S-box-containing protein